jgi:hypothetical protein
MEINPNLVWQIVVTIIIAPLAYFLREALTRLRDMESNLSRTREQLAKEYATKADLHLDVNRVIDRIEKIDTKLDRLLARAGNGNGNGGHHL